MAKMQEYYSNTFRGGLVTNVSNDSLSDEEFPVIENVDFDNRGSMIRRLGYENLIYTNEELYKKYPFYSQEEIDARYFPQRYEGFQQGYFRFIAKPYKVNGQTDFETLPEFSSDEPVDRNLIYSNTAFVNNETFRAFDRNTNTFWTGDDLTILGLEGARLGVCISTVKGKRLFSYKITNNGTARTMTFTLYGSKTCIETDLEFGNQIDVQTIEFGSNETKEFILEEPTERLRAFVLNITSSSDNNYGISEFELGLEKITERNIYDFGNHSEPSFDEPTSEVRLIAVEGKLWIADLQSNVDTFGYKGNVLPQNSEPIWRKEISKFGSFGDNKEPTEQIISGERLEIVSETTYPQQQVQIGTQGSVQYRIKREIEPEVLDLQFDLKILLDGNALEPFNHGINAHVFGGSIYLYSFYTTNKIYLWGNGGVTIDVPADDEEFHNYRWKIDGVNRTVEFYFDGTLYYSDVYPDFGRFGDFLDVVFGHDNVYYGDFQIDTASEWKNYKLSTSDSITINQIESDLVYGNFQNLKTIEAAQYRNELFITTGTKLISCRFIKDDSGTRSIVAQEVDTYAYVPNTKEFLYGGANILNSEKPDIVLDTQGNTTAFSVDIFRTDPIRPYVDNDTTIKAYVTTALNKTIADYEFRWEYKESDSDDAFIEGRDYTAGDLGRVYNFETETSTKYTFKCIMREISTTDPTNEKLLTNIEFTEIDENTETNTAEEINTCTKIDLYYGKLLVYENGTSNMFKTFSSKITWFATSGVIPFNNLRQEPLVKVIPLRNSVLGFTENSTIGLIGKGDDIAYQGRPFEPFTEFITFNANIGCIAPNSVAITNDDKAVFLSERGLHFIDTLAVDAGRADVIKIDDKINNIILRDNDASGVVYNNKFYLSYPRKNYMIVWHYVFGGIFSLDTSDELGFNLMYNIDNEMIGLSRKSKIMKQQKLPFRENLRTSQRFSNQNYFTDDGLVYDMYISSKFFTFGVDRVLKRFMRAILEFSSVEDEQIELYVNVYADDLKIVSSDSSYYDIVEQDGQRYSTYIEQESPNAEGNVPIILGQWELGRDSLGEFSSTYRYYDIRITPEAYKTKIEIRHSQDTFMRIVAFGFSYILGYIPRELSGRL